MILHLTFIDCKEMVPFIPFLNLDGRKADLPSEIPRGSNAVNALNRFSQSNDPEMNQLLEDNARSGARATEIIVTG